MKKSGVSTPPSIHKSLDDDPKPKSNRQLDGSTLVLVIASLCTVPLVIAVVATLCVRQCCRSKSLAVFYVSCLLLVSVLLVSDKNKMLLASDVTWNLGAPYALRQNIRVGPLGLSPYLKIASVLTQLGRTQS